MTSCKSNLDEIDKSRRTFIKQGALIGSGIIIVPTLNGCLYEPSLGTVLEPSEIVGLKSVDGDNLLQNSQWYEGDNVQEGFLYRFEAGTLVNKKYITTDMLAEGLNSYSQADRQ